MELELTEKLKSSPFVRELAFSWKEFRNSERGINTQLSIGGQGKYETLLENVQNTKVHSFKKKIQIEAVNKVLLFLPFRTKSCILEFVC
jgi:hypothetical protein